jgi:formate dehydrogenase major subunit
LLSFTPTICPYCGAGCGILLAVKEGNVVGTKPWPRHQISGGRLCLKGWNAHQFIGHQDRLKKPLIRDNGLFREATWDEALNLVADKLEEVKGKDGPDAIAFLSSAKCTNEENYLIQKFARAVVGTNNVDHCARLCHASTVAGLIAAFGSGAMTNSISDLAQADCIFIIGSDTTAQHPLVARRIVMAKERGAKIIIADPKGIQLCNLADVYLQHKPGSDVALLNGIMKAIIDHGLEDKEFIRERTEGFQELAEMVRGYPLDKVEMITGVPAADIEKAALIYAQAESSAIVFAMGITQHTTGTDNVMSTANLAMLTGNVGRAGSGINPLRGQNNVQGACDMGALPNVLPGYQAVTDAEKRAKIAKVWGVAELPPRAGLTVIEMINAASEGKIKAMYITGENPMVSDPDISHVKQGLESLEFLVVQDMFLTETARLADVVLPSASWAEREGTFTNTERRVQRIRKAIDPRGESRPDWEILCQLASVIGAGQLFPFNSPGEIFDELRKVTPQYAGMNYQRLNQPDGLQWPCPDESHPGTPILHTKQFTRGKGKFHAVAYRAPAEEPDSQYPYILTTGRVMSQWHTGTMTRRSPALDNEFPEAFVEVNTGDANRLGIEDGDWVEVTSRRGKIRIKALVSDKIRPGVIFIPFHFAECAANMLTNPALDPIAKIPELKVCAAAIQPTEQSK